MKKVVIIACIALFVGCVSAQLKERMRSTEDQIARVESLLQTATDDTTLQQLGAELERLRAVQEEQEAQASEERIESVEGVAGVAGGIVETLAPLLGFLGVPAIAGIVGSLGRGLKTIGRPKNA